MYMYEIPGKNTANTIKTFKVSTLKVKFIIIIRIFSWIKFRTYFFPDIKRAY